MKNQQRETFSSGLAVFFATLGSAVGLGNIWKFPYMIGANGGAAFLLIYFLCVLFVGLPIMVSEFYIGRKTRKNVIGAMKQLKPNSAWKSIGVFGIITAYLIMFFYTCVAGWVYFYVFKAIKGDFSGVTVESSKAMFGAAVVGPISPIIWQIIVLTVVSAILIMGVQKGIEKVTKTLMPVLFLLIIICDIRALMLPGSSEGLKFLFKVDFSMLTKQSILMALGLAFFKLSLGMGTMVTYGSYFTKDNNLINTSVKVALSDTLVSVLAGIAIFPAVFAFNMKPGAGPGLLFMTIPLVFSKIPFGNILLVLFFILTSIAATTAMMSILEVLIAYFTEEKGLSRKKAVIFNAIFIAVIGVLASLSADSSSILGNIKIFGKGFFDLFDFVSSNILMPIGGLLIAVFMGYMVKKDEIRHELSNHGTLNIDWAINLYYFILRYIAPVLLIIVFLNSIGILKF
ncbi:sodium-dependent transporter [Clostridium magnum]|uniref:Transporter n=1 Tax=Clostridium magnum DSM 2767 TaxID=1121326 RepID=A0A162RI72_9CLOT|nr:sodium-dependent transporter [Clostridium magnum]KZL89939.1 sodium:neurotransmitter symporter family protein [Clostridium magnum DSM 2767]SHJ33589.1 neurotransmitter:Na+ symporter, NSS family [Clostridium magnum DSM 2767]